ncbi:amidohydrolase family protein [Candidatus Harpocratesius sp.]
MNTIEQYVSRLMPSEWKNLNLEQKYKGPKFDAHTHIYLSVDNNFTNFDEVLKVADANNITKIAAIVDRDIIHKLENTYPDRFIPIRFLDSKKLFEEDRQSITDMFDEIYSKGYQIVKLWFAPRWRDFVLKEFGISEKKIEKFKLSSPIFQPIFEKLEELKLKLLIHISDPDLWYEKKYQPESRYGSKSDHLTDFEEILKNYPKIQFQVAHFGGQPENLHKLANWLDKYSNLLIDTSSARWIGRELSQKVEDSKNFIEHYSDRILFGTDLSFGWTRDNTPEAYFLTRYLTFHVLFETNSRNIPLPFPDPENNNKTILNGLNLSQTTLKKIYFENANRFYK